MAAVDTAMRKAARDGKGRSRKSATTHNAAAGLDSTLLLLALAIEYLAFVRAMRGDHRRAAALEGYADAGFQRHGYKRDAPETTMHERIIALLRQRLTPHERERLTAEGAALTPDAAVALALE